MRSILTVLSLALATSAFANSNSQKAADAYASRAYTEVGITQVEEAIQFYEEAISEATNADEKMELQTKVSQAYYFIGTVYGDDVQKLDGNGNPDAKATVEAKLQAFTSGMAFADVVLVELGVEKPHELSDSEIETLKASLGDVRLMNLAQAIYFKTINLAQWGQILGPDKFLDRLGEIFDSMGNVIKLGHQAIHHHGPNRTIGRTNFVLASLGLPQGDIDVAKKNLVTATKATQVSGKKYSRLAYNTVYTVEALYASGQEKAAKSILKDFVNDYGDPNTDPAVWAQDSKPENDKAFLRAQELVAEWQVDL